MDITYIIDLLMVTVLLFVVFAIGYFMGRDSSTDNRYEITYRGILNEEAVRSLSDIIKQYQ